MTAQRIFALTLLLACGLLAAMAWPYQAPFSYEPVGPRAYPLLMLALLAAALAWLAWRPGVIVRSAEEPPLDCATVKKIAACTGLLLLFAGLFESLGFVLASVLAGIPMARLYGGRWLPATAVISLMSVALYLLFDKAMDVPLPLGLLDFVEN
ncbi:tripartite tricarboxylate transporter TctB family protein [Pseudomonas sp. HR96]|uniref:tripartite tricarboxylate transporter TctB family protein n=1 Tax=Pseudomonas sp. HR96 TaxID=1027966 RepID=UPI002A74810E|nr:tripartite tricarboxylate transporter TctB family protein [Pseudomonas sp. HR96]WPP00874.1 tripartite tricarboxylate transporter TctB family protein [Pseudomonas sp. HR96]